jgi:hypothetical protein
MLIEFRGLVAFCVIATLGAAAAAATAATTTTTTTTTTISVKYLKANKTYIFNDLRSNISFPPDFTSFSVWKGQRVYEKGNGYWWNDTDKGNPKCSEKTLMQCHLVHYKSSHMD